MESDSHLLIFDALVLNFTSHFSTMELLFYLRHDVSVENSTFIPERKLSTLFSQVLLSSITIQLLNFFSGAVSELPPFHPSLHT